MLSYGLRTSTQQRRLTRETQPKTRLSKGDKRNAKRMAPVASIYYIARLRRHPKEVLDEYYRRKANLRRPKPVAKRIGASVEKDAAEVIDNLVVQAVTSAPTPNKEGVVLVEGHNYQVAQIKAALERQQVPATMVLDIVPVIEYLWKAAHQFCEEGSFSCERWVKSKLQMILEQGGRNTAGSLRMSAAKRLPTGPQKLSKQVRYLSLTEPLTPIIKTT